jgi:hypothetical protein
MMRGKPKDSSFRQTAYSAYCPLITVELLRVIQTLVRNSQRIGKFLITLCVDAVPPSDCGKIIPYMNIIF